jgi:hypothetical protein
MPAVSPEGRWISERIGELERKVRALETTVNGGAAERADSPTYAGGRLEGHADIAQRLRVLVDPKGHLDIDGLLDRVADEVRDRLLAQNDSQYLRRQIAEAFEVLERRGFRPPAGAAPSLATLMADAFAAQSTTFTEALDKVQRDAEEVLAATHVRLRPIVETSAPLEPGEWRIEVGKRRPLESKPVVGVP